MIENMLVKSVTISLILLSSSLGMLNTQINNRQTDMRDHGKVPINVRNIRNMIDRCPIEMIKMV